MPEETSLVKATFYDGLPKIGERYKVIYSSKFTCNSCVCTEKWEFAIVPVDGDEEEVYKAESHSATRLEIDQIVRASRNDSTHSELLII